MPKIFTNNKILSGDFTYNSGDMIKCNECDITFSLGGLQKKFEKLARKEAHRDKENDSLSIIESFACKNCKKDGALRKKSTDIRRMLIKESK